VLARVVAAGARHAALDLVGDHDDAVLGAPLLQDRQVALGGHHEAALALDGLDHEAGEVAAPDAFSRYAIVRAAASWPRGRRGRGRSSGVVHVARERAEPGGVGARLVVHGHREVGAAVVGVVEHRDGAAARELAGDLHAVLDRLGARVHEHAALLQLPGVCSARSSATRTYSS
jgi:hypothetical protein